MANFVHKTLSTFHHLDTAFEFKEMGCWVLTEDEYAEYQDLKKFKEDAEREIKEIDESEWEVCDCPECRGDWDEETLLDRVDDLEGDINTLKEDLADSDYSTIKFMKGQRINNEYFLTAIEGLADGMEGLYRIVNELTARKEDVQPKSKPTTKRKAKVGVEKSTRSK